MKKPSKPRPSSSSKASPEAPTARLFFALWPPPALLPVLAATAAGAAESLGGKAMRAGTLHLTLRFLGEFPVDRIPQLIAAAQTVAFPAFALTLDRLGAWAHNRLLWAGCRAVPPALPQLAARLGQALAAAGLGAPPDGRDFVPHLTLVRKLVRLPDAAAPNADLPPLAWPVGEFVLLRSRRAADGSHYETLARFPADAAGKPGSL